MNVVNTKEVWWVLGDSDRPFLWRTKEDAEKYARELFPDESPDTRYARIYYKEVFSYETVKGE
jgi:hypothetical protein